MIKPSEMRAWRRRAGFVRVDLGCGQKAERLIEYAKKHPNSRCIGVDFGGFYLKNPPQNVLLLKEDILSRGFELPQKVKADEIEVNFFDVGPHISEKWLGFLKDRGRLVVRFTPPPHSSQQYVHESRKWLEEIRARNFRNDVARLAEDLRSRGFSVTTGVQRGPKKKYITAWEKYILSGQPASLEDEIASVRRVFKNQPEQAAFFEKVLPGLSDKDIEDIARANIECTRRFRADEYPFLIATRRGAAEKTR